MNAGTILKRSRLWMGVPLIVLASCRVSQPYKRPADVAGNGLYRDVATTDTTSIGNMPWKQLFTDTALQSLISEGIQNNLDLQVANARIAAADANFKQSRLAFLPSVNANASVQGQKVTASQFGRTQTFEVYGSASWEADIWGKLRSAKRANLALLLQSDAYKRAVQTQLVADIATNYYSLLALDAQLQVTLKTVENRKLDVQTVTTLKESDVVNGAAVVQSQANQYAAAVTIPDLQQDIRQTENAICLLLGRNPGPVNRDSLMDQTVTTDLRTGVPMLLLANRPDVQEAEYQFRYNFELTNQARSYFYPALTVTGQAGWSSLAVNSLFDASSVFATVLAGLTQPIFNQGINKQRLAVAKANQEESLATFKKTLLSAGEDVSNALYAYQAATDKIGIRAQQIEYLQKAVDYTKELLKYTNTTNYTDVLTSEQSLLAAQLNHVTDKLQQLQAVVSLYRSLGGGWK